MAANPERVTLRARCDCLLILVLSFPDHRRKGGDDDDDDDDGVGDDGDDVDDEDGDISSALFSPTSSSTKTPS